MKISIIIPRWPKKSFWDVIAFKFPLLSTSLLAGLTPSHHQLCIIDESLTEIDFNQEVDLVAITAITPLAPRGYEIADEFRRRVAQGDHFLKTVLSSSLEFVKGQKRDLDR